MLNWGKRTFWKAALRVKLRAPFGEEVRSRQVMSETQASFPLFNPFELRGFRK